MGAITGYFSSPGGRGAVDILQGAYTALPTQIFSFATKPAGTWGALTSAAIVVLLIAILAVNAIAILLRNRYERKW